MDDNIERPTVILPILFLNDIHLFIGTNPT